MRAHGLAWWTVVCWAVAAGAPGAQVRPGITVLLTDSARLVAGRRIGLLTNQTGVDPLGRRDVDLLRGDARMHLVRLFSPEHGFRGTEDGAVLANSVDQATGLPIYSLYTGSPTARPVLDSLDAVVIDLQDVGARYYTYVSTAIVLMKAAAQRRIPVVVLDRPNPLGGVAVQGNVRAAAPDSIFVGFLAVPMRHGMTLGELLRLANATRHIGARLTVVPATGWKRGDYFDHTGLPWVRPSPNMPDLESALHYPGTCLFEGTNLSVGRGTERAFQWIGAPWLDTAAVLRRLREAGGLRDALRGAAVTADTVTPHGPGDAKYDGIRINVVRLRVIDRRAYDPTHAAVALLAAIHAVQRDSFAFQPAGFDRLAGSPTLRKAILAERAPSAIWRMWDSDLARFRRVRAEYLLY